MPLARFRILVEHKTTIDFLVSLEDDRLFRPERQLVLDPISTSEIC